MVESTGEKLKQPPVPLKGRLRFNHILFVWNYSNVEMEEQKFGIVLQHRSFFKWRRRWRMRSAESITIKLRCAALLYFLIFIQQ